MSDTREQAEASVRAGAWALAAVASKNEATKLLRKVAKEIEDSQWQGGGSR